MHNVRTKILSMVFFIAYGFVFANVSKSWVYAQKMDSIFCMSQAEALLLCGIKNKITD